MSKVKQLPPRSKVKPADCWDLASLCKSDAAWETAFKKWEGEIKGYEKFAGHSGESAKKLAECLEFDIAFDRTGERLGTYAFLKTTEDQANSTYQRMIGRYQNAASRAGQAASYIRPEIMAIPEATMKKFLAAKELAPHRFPWNACCATSRTRWRNRKKNSWPCRPRWPKPPIMPSAN